MTSQSRTGQLNAYSDLDELAATRREREQLRARVALLESNYADLRQAARDEIELKEQENEKLRAAAGLTFIYNSVEYILETSELKTENKGFKTVNLKGISSVGITLS